MGPLEKPALPAELKRVRKGIVWRLKGIEGGLRKRVEK
jgi:hypothetical protein